MSIPKTHRRVVLVRRPPGEPAETDFRVEEAPVPEPRHGEVLVKVHYLSLDPYQRGRMRDAASYAAPVGLGEVMTGGIVGEVVKIDPEIIHLLDERDFIPVIAPIGADDNGTAYNINADVVAGKMAEVLGAEKLLMMTNTPGVLDKDGKLLRSLSATTIDALFADGTISGYISATKGADVMVISFTVPVAEYEIDD